MKEFEDIEWRSVSLLRLAGYGLLILSLLDFINIFIPPRFTNPIWEFQMIGELVEKMPVPLIGMVFVFFGKDDFRKEWEEIILKVLSWLALILGVLFLLMLPLGITNTIRLNNLNNLQVNNQLAQRNIQLQQISETLSKANSESDIEQALTSLKFQGDPANVQNKQELKNKILSDISNTQKQLQKDSEIARKNQQMSLIKNSVKWNLGALIAGILFIYIWSLTKWAR